MLYTAWNLVDTRGWEIFREDIQEVVGIQFWGSNSGKYISLPPAPRPPSSLWRELVLTNFLCIIPEGFYTSLHI